MLRTFVAENQQVLATLGVFLAGAAFAPLLSPSLFGLGLSFALLAAVFVLFLELAAALPDEVYIFPGGGEPTRENWRLVVFAHAIFLAILVLLGYSLVVHYGFWRIILSFVPAEWVSGWIFQRLGRYYFFQVRHFSEMSKARLILLSLLFPAIFIGIVMLWEAVYVTVLDPYIQQAIHSLMQDGSPSLGNSS